MNTIFELRQFSREALHKWIGKHGVDLWERAHGRATSTIHPLYDAKSLSSERTFGKDTDDASWLRKVIISLTEKLVFELRAEKKFTSCVAVKIRYSDFSTHTKQLAIPITSNTKVLTEKMLYLFDEFYETGRKVRLQGIKLSELETGDYQINLFDDREKDILLYKAIDEMKHKHGPDKITLAQNLNLGNMKHNDPKAFLNKKVKSNK